MKLKELKDRLLLEREEIIINKKIVVRGKEILLLSFIKEENSNKLWTMYKKDSNLSQEDEEHCECEGENYECEEYEYIHITNREELVSNIENSCNLENINFTEMIIQGQKITFQSSSAGTIEYYDAMEMIMLQHFIKKGMISKEWDDVSLSDIVISTYEQSEEEDFPQINHNEKLTISLNIDEAYEEVLIQYPFTLALGKSYKNDKIYYDKENKDYFYLNEVDKYDLWKDSLEKLDKVIMDVEECDREDFRNNYIESLEGVCPTEMDLLIISYETEDNTQLRFLTKEYLEEEPVYDSFASGMFLICGNEKGINGYEKRIDYLKPVEKDFAGELEVELFSKYIKIPKEIITFEI